MKTIRIHLHALFTTSLLFVLMVSTANAGTLISTVTRNQISNNETLTLNVKYDQRVDSSALGLDALDQDFEILSVTPSTSSSTSIVNGKVSKEESITWRIILAPKREGSLTIPAFSVNGDQSQAIRVDVQSGSSSSNTATDNPFSVLISADNNEIYSGQQLLIEVEISAAADVSNLSGPELEIDNADVELIAQDKSQRLENGLVRQVIVLRYVVFAKQAGKLKIPSMTFTATQGGRRSFFDARPGKRVLARTNELEVDVKPIDSSRGPWFPANNVSITSRWSGDISTMTVGEPITRTVVITAQGQRASVIPPLQASSANTHKSYKDQAQLDDGKTESGYVGTRIESEAIVASQTGQLILPEQRIAWWDVKAQQWREAILPSQAINVAENTSINSDQAIQQTTSQTQSETLVTRKTHWLWPLACGLLALICLLQTWFIWQLQKRPSTTQTPLKVQNQSEAKRWKSLENAIASSEPTAIRQAIINWGQTLGEEQRLTTLDKIAEFSNDADLTQQLKQAFNALESSLYKADNTPTDLQSLAHLMVSLRETALRSNRKIVQEHTGLKPLYNT